MDFIKFAGIELLKKSYIKNLSIERLEEDPNTLDINLGRIWYNTTDKKIKLTLLNDSEEVEIKSLPYFDDLINLSGSSLIGYEGWNGEYNKFNIPEDTTIKNSLDLISEKLDENTMSIYDINNGILDNLQIEINNTRYYSGLSILNGSYTADPSANYIDTATTLYQADQLLDAQLKSLEDDLNQIELNIGDGIISSINDLNFDLNNLQNELDYTQLKAGLNTNGGYTPSPSANYINTATTLYEADQLLDTQLKSFEDEITTNTNLYDISENIDENPLWKGSRWPIREDLIYKTISLSSINHTISHNLNSQYIQVDVWVKDPIDSKYKLDTVDITIEDNNIISISLTDIRDIIVIVQSR